MVDTSELLRTRVIPLDGEITDETATHAIAKVLFLRSSDPTRPIVLRIDSHGGLFTAGVAIVDVIAETRDLVRTACHSEASGIAALILASGARGKRTVSGGAHVSIGPLEPRRGITPVVAEEISRIEAFLIAKLASCTGQPTATVTLDVRNGRSFDAQEAVTYGLADALE